MDLFEMLKGRKSVLKGDTFLAIFFYQFDQSIPVFCKAVCVAKLREIRKLFYFSFVMFSVLIVGEDDVLFNMGRDMLSDNKWNLEKYFFFVNC